MPGERTIVLALNGDLFDNMNDAVRAIAAWIGINHRVVAVVGAPARQDACALAQANSMPVHTDESVYAWIRTEPARKTAALLAEALEADGVRAAVIDTAAFGPTVKGPVLDAEPRTISARALEDAFADAAVVIVPGGVAHTEDRRPAILGDGSPLLTALFIADRLALPVRDVRRRPRSRTAQADEPAHVLQMAIDYNDRRSLLFARTRNVGLTFASVEDRAEPLPQGPPDFSSRIGKAARPQLRGTAAS